MAPPSLQARQRMEREKTLVQSNPINDYVLNSLVAGWSADSLHAAGAIPLFPCVSAGRWRADVPFLTAKNNQMNGQISSDGNWVAYASDESGQLGSLCDFVSWRGRKWQVSRGGGIEPRWRGDGKEIFYMSPSGMLMAVPVSNDNGFSTGTPVPLFQIHGRAPISSTDAFTYDVAKDGKRFLVNRYVSPEHVPPLTNFAARGRGQCITLGPWPRPNPRNLVT